MSKQASFWNTESADEPAASPRTPRTKTPKRSPFDKAFAQAMNRLNRRSLSVSQLRAKLIQLKHDEATVSLVIERVKEIGAIDDEKLARQLVAEVMRRGPAGPPLLRKKLARFGFERTLVDRVVSEATAGVSPLEEARALVAKRLPSLERFPRETRLRRLAGLLARRGLDSELIHNVLSEL